VNVTANGTITVQFSSQVNSLSGTQLVAVTVLIDGQPSPVGSQPYNFFITAGQPFVASFTWTSGPLAAGGHTVQIVANTSTNNGAQLLNQSLNVQVNTA
jgi:hypothetical protein